MEAMASDSRITIAEMATMAGTTDRTVKRYLKEFQESGVLVRTGSDPSGEWILVKIFECVFDKVM